MSRKERSVILFVVEGPSDETALASIFERVFAKNNVQFDAVHTDLTTKGLYDPASKGKGVLMLLRDFVIAHVLKSSSRYKWSDLCRIVCLVDMDGAFIDDDLVVEDNVERVVYTENRIICKDAVDICRRNKHKSHEIKGMRSKRALTYQRKEVPLEVYFMSRNMDHALNGEIDYLADEEKEDLAYEFQEKYVDDIPGFRSFLSSEIAAPGDDRAATWAFIESGTHSLERWSNLHFVLPEEDESQD